MSGKSDGVYLCPMHSDVRRSSPGALQPEGTRFAMLRHMISNPLHVIVMVVVMLVLMAVAMMILR